MIKILSESFNIGSGEYKSEIKFDSINKKYQEKFIIGHLSRLDYSSFNYYLSVNKGSKVVCFSKGPNIVSIKVNFIKSSNGFNLNGKHLNETCSYLCFTYENQDVIFKLNKRSKEGSPPPYVPEACSIEFAKLHQ